MDMTKHIWKKTKNARKEDGVKPEKFLCSQGKKG